MITLQFIKCFQSFRQASLLALIVVNFGPFLHGNAGIHWREESGVDFTLDSRVMDNMESQISFEFVDVKKISRPAYASIFNADYLKQASLAQKSRAVDNDLKVKKLLLVKSAFKVSKSIRELQVLLTPARLMNTLKHVNNLSYDEKCLNHCAVKKRVTAAGLTQDVHLRMVSNVYSLKEVNENTSKVMNDLNVSKAELELRIYGSEWDRLFTVSQSVSYFIPEGNSTLIVNYQILSIKESAYSKLPFFLEAGIEFAITKEYESLIEFLRNSPLAQNNYLIQRMPAGSSPLSKNLYKQEQYLLVDPIGDEELIGYAAHLPVSLMEYFKRKFKSGHMYNPEDPWLPEAWEHAEPIVEPYKPLVDSNKPVIQGRENPIRIKNLLRTFKQVIIEENLTRGTEPKMGQFHKWSDEVLQRYNKNSWVTVNSKLLVALAAGYTGRFMKTDQEENLHHWIIAQPFNSITLPEMFRKSYQLNKGDIYLTLLTIENHLAANWKYAERDTLPLTRRLKPITSGYNFSSDRFGTWYHFFGMVLYGYVYGGTHANLIGRIEALGSFIMNTKDVKTQKIWLNKMGGYIGSDLKGSIKKGSWKDLENDPSTLSEDFYLNKEEDFRDRLTYPISSNFEVWMTGTSAAVTGVEMKSIKDDLYRCKVDIMFANTVLYDSATKIKKENIDFIRNKTVAFQISFGKTSGIRVFVSECQGNDEVYVMEATNTGLF